VPKFLRNLLEWLGHFETIQAIIHTEFVRTLLVPTLMGAMTASAGYLGGIPFMWILMATALAFMATMQGLLRASELIERKNPEYKLRFLQSAIAIDFDDQAQPNRAARRIGNQQPLPRTINRMQLGVTLHNSAAFPIAVFIEHAESEIEEYKPPRTQYPKPTTIVPAGSAFTLYDERMLMEHMQCRNIVGKYTIRVKYGLPKKEHFTFEHSASLNIQIHPLGIVTGIHDGLLPSSTT
jgi:hypothetical protein